MSLGNLIAWFDGRGYFCIFFHVATGWTDCWAGCCLGSVQKAHLTNVDCRDFLSWAVLKPCQFVMFPVRMFLSLQVLSNVDCLDLKTVHQSTQVHWCRQGCMSHFVQNQQSAPWFCWCGVTDFPLCTIIQDWLRMMVSSAYFTMSSPDVWVMVEQGEQEGAEHTALGGSSVEH